MWEDEIKEVIGLIIVSSITIILFFALYYSDTNETLLAEKREKIINGKTENLEILKNKEEKENLNENT